MKTEHVWHECSREGCYICESGLGACDVCNGFEGTLTTDCCGRPITEEETKQIYEDGTLDFRDGKWVNLPNFTRFDGEKIICIDGERRTKEEFREWCAQLKANVETVTDPQLVDLLRSGE